MNTKDFIVGLVSVAAAVGIVGFFGIGGKVVQQFGATPGNDFTNEVTFQNGINRSNAVASTTSGSQTVTAGEFRQWANASIVNLTPRLVAASTITLPATSTIPDVVPKTGDSKSFCVRNATSTAAIYMTLAGGTGMNLVVASSSATAVGGTKLLSDKIGCVTLIRQADSDIDALLTVYQ